MKVREILRKCENIWESVRITEKVWEFLRECEKILGSDMINLWQISEMLKVAQNFFVGKRGAAAGAGAGFGREEEEVVLKSSF